MPETSSANLPVIAITQDCQGGLSGPRSSDFFISRAPAKAIIRNTGNTKKKAVVVVSPIFRSPFRSGAAVRHFYCTTILPDLRDKLSADCVKHHAAEYDRCDLYFPDMLKVN